MHNAPLGDLPRGVPQERIESDTPVYHTNMIQYYDVMKYLHTYIAAVHITCTAEYSFRTAPAFWGANIYGDIVALLYYWLNCSNRLSR